jgi:hypothetical protein
LSAVKCRFPAHPVHPSRRLAWFRGRASRRRCWRPTGGPLPPWPRATPAATCRSPCSPPSVKSNQGRPTAARWTAPARRSSPSSVPCWTARTVTLRSPTPMARDGTRAGPGPGLWGRCSSSRPRGPPGGPGEIRATCTMPRSPRHGTCVRAGRISPRRPACAALSKATTLPTSTWSPSSNG